MVGRISKKHVIKQDGSGKITIEKAPYKPSAGGGKGQKYRPKKGSVRFTK